MARCGGRRAVIRVAVLGATLEKPDHLARPHALTLRQPRRGAPRRHRRAHLRVKHAGRRPATRRRNARIRQQRLQRCDVAANQRRRRRREPPRERRRPRRTIPTERHALYATVYATEVADGEMRRVADLAVWHLATASRRPP